MAAAVRSQLFSDAVCPVGLTRSWLKNIICLQTTSLTLYITLNEVAALSNAAAKSGNIIIFYKQP